MKDKSSRVAPALGTAVTVRYEQFRLGRTPRCPGGGGRPKETPPMENNSSDSQNLAPLALAGMTRFQIEIPCFPLKYSKNHFAKFRPDHVKIGQKLFDWEACPRNTNQTRARTGYIPKGFIAAARAVYHLTTGVSIAIGLHGRTTFCHIVWTRTFQIHAARTSLCR